MSACVSQHPIWPAQAARAAVSDCSVQCNAACPMHVCARVGDPAYLALCVHHGSLLQTTISTSKHVRALSRPQRQLAAWRGSCAQERWGNAHVTSVWGEGEEAPNKGLDSWCCQLERRVRRRGRSWEVDWNAAAPPALPALRLLSRAAHISPTQRMLPLHTTASNHACVRGH